MTPIPTPREAARALAIELAALGVLELSALAALAAVAERARPLAIATTIAAAAVLVAARTAIVVAIVARQRVVHRAAIAAAEDRFVPSARIVELARRAALAPWACVPLWALAALALAPRAAPGLALGLALLAAPAIAARARAPIDRWLARIPIEDLGPRRIELDATLGALDAAAPALAIAAIGVALAGPIAAAALAPALVLAARGWREAHHERDELDRVAARIARIEPGTEPAGAALATASGRAAYDEAHAILGAARDAVRTDADAKNAIEREEQVRARFMAAMGHELRSPLNSIVGFAQLLEDGAEGQLAPSQRESVVLVRRSAEDLLRLLTDILDSARLDAQRLRIERAWTPSVEIVTEAVRLGRAIVEGRPIAIEAEVQPGLPPVLVDRARVVQAVVATFRHAVRGASSGRIEVHARVGSDPSRRRALRVEVRDPGRTLPREELERIFDAFGDLRDASTGRRIGGLGLALSLARKLVRLQGGEVWAESSAEHGVRYVVALPLEGAP